jgi:hypothetical protein
MKIWFVAGFALAIVWLAAVMLRASAQKTSPKRASTVSSVRRKDKPVKTELATFGGG